jgi:small subunit ribosomal protein S7
MPRKGPAQRRELIADPIYRSLLVTQLTNKVMLHGKKSIAEKIVYDAMQTHRRRRLAKSHCRQ